MTLSRYQKIGIIVAAVIAVGAIVAIVVVNRGEEVVDTPTELDIDSLPEANTQPVETQPSEVEGGDAEIEQSERATVARLARIVVERNGSYSNRNNFENYTSLEPFMTERYKQEILEYIDEQQQSGFTEEFYGIATTAASIDVVEFNNEESAEIIVSTSRIESRSNQDDVSFTQDAQVRFVYVEGTWKVDGITWL